MISAIRIRNYKGIKRSPWIELGQFHVLVGPNASGKSTFLDAIEFVKTCLIRSPVEAVEERADFRDLTFLRQGGPIEFDIRLKLAESAIDTPAILSYRLVLTSDQKLGIRVREELLSKDSGNGARAGQIRRILGKTQTGNDFYRREQGTYTDSFQFGPGKLALSLIPPDRQRYPTGNAVREFLTQGVRYLQLNSVAMRRPTPATRPAELELDGTNLARVVGNLVKNAMLDSESESGLALSRWTDHLRYALKDLQSIGWAARKPDNAEYLVLRFDGGLECPSWLLSDGTLRMLALTLPAFLPGQSALYMVEEPENGVHPHAIEIILKALAAIPRAQVFIATHSPLVIQEVGPGPLLCFTRENATGVRIVHGPNHPALKNWDGTPDLSSIFSSRVLG
ncbi:MAG: AAA family ATPase [Bryobacteraceae bacterium]